MADIIYPDDYLPMPLMDGYGFKPISPLKRTEMTSGRARQRRLYTSTPTQASVKWIFQTDALAQVFEAFFPGCAERWTVLVLHKVADPDRSETLQSQIC